MQLLKCAGCAGVATGSILVYAYILMYYTKNQGFENEGFENGRIWGVDFLDVDSFDPSAALRTGF